MGTVDGRLMQARRPSALGMLARQVVYQLRMLVRSPIGSFATLVIPLMVLLAVNLLFAGTRLPSRGNIRFAQFFTPAMVAFAVVNSCYMSVVASTTLARDMGILKRIRSTPLPSWIYMAGRVISAAAVAVTSAIVVLAVGGVLYGFQMIWSRTPDAVLSLLAAMFSFCALGLAVTVLVPKADSALPVAWGTILPLCFISDVFQPIDHAPHWLQTVASAFPLRPFADDVESAFNPVTGGGAIHVGHLLVVLGWGAAALVFALVRFRWEPKGDHAGGGSPKPLGRSFSPERLGGLLARGEAATPVPRTAPGSIGGESTPPAGEQPPQGSRSASAGGPQGGSALAGRHETPARAEDSSAPRKR